MKFGTNKWRRNAVLSDAQDFVYTAVEEMESAAKRVHGLRFDVKVQWVAITPWFACPDCGGDPSSFCCASTEGR
jgi:hypothetical protein